MAKKGGARTTDQNKIRKLSAQGLTIEEISDNLQIEEATIKSFVNQDKPEEIDPVDPELTEDQKTEITELADDNTTEEIATALDIELSLVEAFLEAE